VAHPISELVGRASRPSAAALAGWVALIAGHIASASAADPVSPPPLVVSIGDSIAYGFGAPAPATQSYAARYARAVGARLLNLAVPGVSCADVAAVQVPKVPRDARLIIVNCGTNDVGGFGLLSSGLPNGRARVAPANDAQMVVAERGFTRMIAVLRRAAPRARIAVVNLRHWERMTGPEAPQFARDVDAWNAMLAATGLRVVDISADRRLYRSRYIERDLLHPNADGYLAIADDVCRAAHAATSAG